MTEEKDRGALHSAFLPFRKGDESMREIETEILKELGRFAYRRSTYTVFFDLIEMIPHFMVESGRRQFDLIEWAEYETAYQKTAAGYTQEERQILYGIFEKIMRQMENDPYDILGAVYMKLIH